LATIGCEPAEPDVTVVTARASFEIDRKALTWVVKRGN